MRTVYLNGHYIPETEAKVSVFDRGFLFLIRLAGKLSPPVSLLHPNNGVH